MFEEFNDLISKNYADEYSILHGEAHKRGAFAVGAPSLSWHLALFVTDEKDSNKVFDVIDHKKVAQISERFFVSILDGIDVECDYEEIKQAAYESANASGPKVLFLSINDILLKVAVTPHSDHFTLTVVVDLSKSAHVNIRTSGDIPEDKVLRLRVEGNSFATHIQHKYLTYAKFADEEGSINEIAATEAKYYLQNGIWERVSSLILKNTLLFVPAKSCIAEHYRYRIFADFRGVLVNCREMRQLLQTTRSSQKNNLVGNDGWFNEKGKHLAGLRSILPLINLGDKTFNYKELIGCTLFRDRAVYLSPLGAPPVYSGARYDNNRPLYFAVAVHENNRWQNGRIIHRLNTLGTLRLLALKDYNKLKEASDKIREVGQDLDRTARETDDASHTTESRIEAEHQRLVKHKKVIDSIGINITGHVAYRVYRSRYRARQFDIQLSDLHVKRIEAWQPYDEFVKRRLYPAFDFISRIGERYERLNQNYQRQLLSLNSEMQSTSGQHLVHIQDEVLEAHAFQHIIESIALGYYGGLVFYYLSKPYYLDTVNATIAQINSLTLKFSTLFQTSFAHNPRFFPLEFWECGDLSGYCQTDKYWQSYCFAAFVLWAAVRFFSSQLQDKRNKRQLLFKRLGLSLKSQLRYDSLFFRLADRLIKERAKYKSYYKKDVERLELTKYSGDDH